MFNYDINRMLDLSSHPLSIRVSEEDKPKESDSLIIKIQEIDDLFKWMCRVHNSSTLNILKYSVLEGLNVMDNDKDEVYNTLKVKHFPECCDKELLKDPKLVLNLMLAF